MSRILSIDIETYSEIDITECGSYRYISDDSFEILLIGYAFDDDPVTVIDLTDPAHVIPEEFSNAIFDPAIIKTAWNCAFERTALGKYFGMYCPPEQWEDTMILSAYNGYPLSLAAAGQALGMEKEGTQKDSMGKRLIDFFSKPRRNVQEAPLFGEAKTRNLPADAPEKWQQYIEYNRQDVVAERAIRKRLEKNKPDETEHKFWCLDARINEAGVRIDRTLAAHAADMSEQYSQGLMSEARRITGIPNPKSPAQVKTWLKESEGIDVDSLDRRVVDDVMGKIKSPEAKAFMALRKEFSKTSTTKFGVMLEATTEEDPHARGCFQFYGSHTGRFAGRLIQFQNLAKNSMPDLAAARALVRDNDYETIKVLYSNVTSTLSELIRTALVPEDGCRFIVSDYSAIEARVTAWLAGEQWRLDVFNNGGDIYCQSASQMFHVPVVKHGVNGHLRQKGKVAELACIAKGQPVLTNQGLIPIEDVTTDMLVWDGEEFVHHDGVVCRGIKEVITYDGLTATPDHLVWVEGKPRPIHFGIAAACGAHLVQAGDGGRAIRACEDHLCGETVEQRLEPLLCSHRVPELRKYSMDEFIQPAKRKIPRLPAMLSTKADTALAGPEADSRKAKMHEPERLSVSKLWRKRNPIRLSKCNRSRSLYDTDLWPSGKSHGAGPHRYEWELCPGESSICNARTESIEQENNGSQQIRGKVLAIRIQHGNKKIVSGGKPGRYHLRCRAGGGGKAKELERHTKTAEVYDILNAGRHHRFTVSGRLVHNCGYGGGVGALKAFGADKMGMTEEEMQETVAKWREASPRIVRMWSTLERAAIKCVGHKQTTFAALPAYRVRFDYDAGTMWMSLPSGRRIAYPEARYIESKFRDHMTLSYMAYKQGHWVREETFSGKLTENLVQAVARDCLRESMMALSDEGFDIRAHVHDEVIVNEPIDGRTVEQVCEIMGRPISWAPGLPLRGDGYECEFYMKD